MRRAARSLPFLLAAAALAACQAAPVAAPAGPAARSASLAVVPTVAGGGAFQLLEVITGYDATSIDHMVVTLADTDAPTVILGTANVGKGMLYNTITFGNLENDQTYLVQATAYDAANAQLSVDATSQVTLAVGSDDRPTLGNLVVTLKDRTFSGEATSDGLTVHAGDLTHAGAPAGTLHTTPDYTIAESVSFAGIPGGVDGTKSVAADKDGNVYLWDVGNKAIIKFTGGSGTGALVGTAPLPGYTGSGPMAMGVDGNLYVASSSAIYKVALPGGAVTRVAGDDTATGDRPTQAEDTVPIATARFWNLEGLVQAPDGSFYTTERGNGTGGHVVRHVVPGGDVTNIGAHDAMLNMGAIAYGRDGKLYVADLGSAVYRADPGTEAFSLFAGTAATYAEVDGPRLGGARFQQTNGLAFDKAGTLFVGDFDAVRRITPKGDVQRGGGLYGSQPHAEGTLTGAPGGNGAARFAYVKSMAVTPTGDLYLVDNYHRMVRLRTGS